MLLSLAACAKTAEPAAGSEPAESKPEERSSRLQYIQEQYPRGRKNSEQEKNGS